MSLFSVMPPRSAFIDQHIAYVEKLVAKGGPDPTEYTSFRQWLDHIAKEYRLEHLSEDELNVLREAFGSALSKQTLQGFSFQKPHGYAGDYEIIDRVYTRHVSTCPNFERWDTFFQACGAVTAVRNRKTYFLQLVTSLTEAFPDRSSLPVLNMASGPGRDLFEFFRQNGRHQAVCFECVDNDPDAIAHAQALCAPYLDRITFAETNALRYNTDTRFQLVWSAGLFDYLSDKGFQFLLERMLDVTRDDGELVVGNFSPRNPTRSYMEVMMDWHLHYRTEDQLTELAIRSGIAEEDIRVGREPEGINLFLHIKRGEDFLPMDRS